jgi:hypothetical protein
MKFILPSALLIVTLSACSSGSADKKVPELANEMCDCFTNFQKDLSTDAMELFKKVAMSPTPTQELAAGISKLKPDDAAIFAKKLTSIGTRGSEVFNCMEAFDRKHEKETTASKKELTEKMLKLMKQNNNCPVGAAVVSIGLANGAVK